MKASEIVNLRKGQRVRMPRYGIVGVIKEISINKTGRIIGIGDIEGSDNIISAGLIYVVASEVELLELVVPA